MASVLGQLEAVQLWAALVVLALLLGWESLQPFFERFTHDRRTRGRHVVRNLVLGGLNAGVVAIVFVALWLGAAEWAAEHDIGLLNVLHAKLGLPLGAHIVAAVLLLDAWTYTWHRMNHRFAFLWRFHRVHHADAAMDVTTASRFHVGEIVLSSALRIPLIVVLGIYAWELVLYETVMFAVVQFHHANIVLPPRVERALRLVIVTPGMHKVHHSRWQPETDSNYSSLFSIWDRIGRSFRSRPDLENIHMGLDEFDDEERFGRLMVLPFSRSVRKATDPTTSPDADDQSPSG